MSTRGTWVLLFALAAAGLILSALFFPALPDPVPTHWNAAGAADGYSPRWTGTLALPAVQIVLCALLMALPLLDPLRKNIAAFRPQYNLLVAALGGFFAYLHAVTLAIAAGWGIPILGALAPAMGGLFFLIGLLLKSAKRNWTMGIRTPWTLSSDSVWEKTHALGSRLFRAAGVVVLASALIPQAVIWVTLAAVIVVTVWTVAYSFWEFRKEGAQG